MKNFKVRFSGESNHHFANGGIYLVKDGFLINEHDYEYGFGDFDSENMERLNRYMRSLGFAHNAFELVKEDSQVFTKDDIRSGDKVWMKNGYGIAIRLGESLIVLYSDHRGWDYILNMEEVQKIVRTYYGGNLLTGNESAGEVLFDREKGIGCEPSVKEISVEEATRLLTEKFGQSVRIEV